PNHLANQKSPYLLQHAENPVDWHPWGPEALELARREDKPILVSIGYSSCHWCHVMAHESFEDESVARIMNERFVNIKVDREERPDVDSIYMEAVQALTGQGGWPLNVFLTPDARPFFGGMYFPPQPRYGVPSWPQVLDGVAETYSARRDDVLHNADVLTRAIHDAQRFGQSEDDLTEELLREAYGAFERQFDWKNGGFGGAPKFPQPMALEFVLRMHRRLGDRAALDFLELTLTRMADGGIYDQLGGGFHRYSVDALWLVPHFEKMLYDNALLARLYTDAYRLTHRDHYREIAEETLDYLLRDLRSPEGAFYSSQDADSEGVEGKYYVWTLEQIEGALESRAARLATRFYGVRAGGNFEGQTILTRAASPEELANEEGMTGAEARAAVDEVRAHLLAVRAHRVPPATDTKILVSWNALAIRALADAGRVFHRPDYLDAARRAADFILAEMLRGGQLVHNYNDGPGTIPGFLDDYAYLIEALLAVYESVFDPRYLADARTLGRLMLERFVDDDGGAFFDTAAEIASLIVRPRSLFDNPIPSGNSSACFALLKLNALTAEDEYLEGAQRVFRAARNLISRAPNVSPYLLSAADFFLSTPAQIAIVGDLDDPATMRLIDTVYDRYLPNAVMAAGEGDGVALLQGRTRVGGQSTAFVCEHFACQLPVTESSELAAQLDAVSP
ncbi:MAG TPA: thioredoxin domain-containing protein, partial [Chloroflexota bacterium]